MTEWVISLIFVLGVAFLDGYGSSPHHWNAFEVIVATSVFAIFLCIFRNNK